MERIRLFVIAFMILAFSPSVSIAAWPHGLLGAVAVAGNVCYLGSVEGLYVLDISTPSAPKKLSELPIGGSRKFSVNDSMLYVAAGYTGLSIIDMSNPLSPRAVGDYKTPNALSVFVSSGYAYVATESGGLLVIDVSTPSSPKEVAAFRSILSPVWDIFMVGHYAYIANGFRRGMRIIDVSVPSSPQEVGVYEVSGYGVSVFDHYACLTTGEELRIIDTSKPLVPQEVGGVHLPAGAFRVVVAGGSAYVANGWAGVQIVDVSNPALPKVVGGYDTPGMVTDVVVVGRYAYVADWNDPTTPANGIALRVIDVSAPSAPREVAVVKPIGATSTAVQESEEISRSFPKIFKLEQNIPNPFNAETSIGYHLPEAAVVRLIVYDLTGRRIRTLGYKMSQPGRYRVTWDGRDEEARKVASGVYLYRLEAKGYREVRRMVLLR